jgi:TonB family protein
MTLAVILSLLLAQVTPSPSPGPTLPCPHGAFGIILDDYPYKGPSKGAPPYFAVVEVRVNPDGSVKWARLYKSSGIADYDHESLEYARHMLVSPKVSADCKPVEGSYFFVNVPRGYTEPQFTPRP